MKYKVGDKVKIRSLEWYNEKKDESGVVFVDKQSFVKEMSEFCGMQATITYASEYRYSIDLDDGEWSWTDEMFEEQLNVKTMEQKKTFEPFERILVFNAVGSYYAKWTCDIFSHISDGFFICLGGIYKIGDYDILPFAGNAHLVGTSDMPCEEVEIKADELCAMFGDEDDIRNCRADIRGFSYAASFSVFDTSGGEYGYCVKLSHFNPNDMEETKKHILCVKNGKLVRARV